MVVLFVHATFVAVVTVVVPSTSTSILDIVHTSEDSLDPSGALPR
jgi:hypothetical protein